MSIGPEPCPIGANDIPSGSVAVQQCADLRVISGAGCTCLALRGHEPRRLMEGGVHKRRSEHGSSAGIADGRLQSAIIPPQTFRLCPGLHTRFIILHDVGRGQSQIMNLAAVGALDTAGHAGRSGQNWVLVSGGT